MLETFREKNAANDVTNLSDLTTADFVSMFSQLICSLRMPELISSAWKRDGVIPYTESVYYDLLAREMGCDVGGASVGGGAGAAPSSVPSAAATNSTEENGIRIVVDGTTPMDVPKLTQAKRARLAKVFNTIASKQAGTAELLKTLTAPDCDLNAHKDPILQQLITFKEVHDLLNDCFKDIAPVPKSSELWTIPGGLTSEAAMARVQISISNAQKTHEKSKRRKEAQQAKDTDDFQAAKAFWVETRPKIGTEADLEKLTKMALQRLHFAAFGKRARHTVSKPALVSAIANKIKEENDMRDNVPLIVRNLPLVPDTSVAGR